MLLFVIPHVLEYFSTVPPISTYEAGIKVMCCSFVITRVRVFQQSHPVPTYKAGLKDVLLFVITRFRVFFNSPTQFPPIKQGLMCCSLWLHVLVFDLDRPVFTLESEPSCLSSISGWSK
jgi:hypothetical protein